MLVDMVSDEILDLITADVSMAEYKMEVNMKTRVPEAPKIIGNMILNQLPGTQ